MSVERPPPSEVIDLQRARELTGLDLVSSREALSIDGVSYHDLEQTTESNSHRQVRDEAIGYFLSIGYHVFPEGVGIRGVFTLADCVAIRPGRTVFVEVLSDGSISPDVLARKAQLQAHAELCFVVFYGSKRANLNIEDKDAIAAWADVLFCSLNAWSGIFIRQPKNMSVAYDTKRERGIRVTMQRERVSSKKSKYAFQFDSHRYMNPYGTPIAYPVHALSYEYEAVFLGIFKASARRLSATLKVSQRNFSTTAYRAMRRPSGLRMVDREGNELVRLRSEYRGSDARPRDTYHVHTLDLPLDQFFCTFEIADKLTAVVETLLEEFERYPLVVLPKELVESRAGV